MSPQQYRAAVLAWLCLCCSALAGSPLERFLKPVELKGRLREGVARLDVDQAAELLDLDVVRGLQQALKYRYAVTRSGSESAFTRVDRWVLKSGLRPGDFLDGGLCPVLLNIERGAEIVFARQFDGRLAAATARPLSPRHLPFTAERALNKVPVGTFVSLPTRLNLACGVAPSAGAWGASATPSAQYLVCGEFRLQLCRLSEHRMLVRLIAGRSRRREVGQEFNLGLDVFELKLVGDRIEQLLDANLARLDWASEWGSAFVVQCVLDLAREEARAAYDHLLGSRLVLARPTLLQSVRSSEDLADLLVTDLDRVARAAEAERGEGGAMAPLRADKRYREVCHGVKVGMNLVRFGTRRTRTENRLCFVGPDGRREDLLYLSNVRSGERSYVFGLAGENSRSSSRILLQCDADGRVRPGGFRDYGITFHREDKLLRASEAAALRDYLRRNLGPRAGSAVAWAELATGELQTHAVICYDLLFHRSAFEEVRGLSREALAHRWDLYCDRMTGTLPADGRFLPGRRKGAEQREVLEVLAESFSRDVRHGTRHEKAEQAMKLQQNGAFREIGPGFLMSLLDPASLADRVRFRMTWTSDQVGRRDYRFGSAASSALYDSLLVVESILADEQFDLRLVPYAGKPAATP